MEKTINHNPYLKELETALATVKANLITDEETTQNIYNNTLITQKASEHLKSDKKKYLDKTTEYYENLAQMSETASEVKLLSQKALKMAEISSADEAAVTKNVALAARSIEAAMEALAILSSDAAAINAKAATEDSDTSISVKAKEAYLKGMDAADAAEKATMSSLQATISAAKSNAKFINELINQFSTNVTGLDTAINSTLLNAKTTMTAAGVEYQTALATASADELNLGIAELNYKSAKEANKEDNIKLGLIEAQKMVKEEKKTTDTSKK